MDLRIALAGNPNSGKTTLFNALTGSNQFVGNWPGVTVEKKEGKLKKHDGVTITDLPGIYSLSPYTLEEVVARNYLIGERPDAILNIVDGTNLERNLYLTTQLTELGIPVVVAINMMDVVRKNGDKINIEELSRELGVKIVEISALKGDGIMQAADAAIDAAKNTKTLPMNIFTGVVEHTLAHIEEAAVHNMPQEQQRWYAIKIFERDDKVLAQLNLSDDIKKHIEEDIKAAEKEGITNFPIHVKLDTGMHRLGFAVEDIPLLIRRLKNQSAVIPRSVFSHFVGSDSPQFDAFTRRQIELFEKGSQELQAAFSHKILRHICNTAGIERFPDAQFDMVRLGIGLYGVSPIDNSIIHNVSTLKTTILQIRDVPQEDTVGYSRMGHLARPSRIAAIPIGYADGLNRHLGRGNAYCLVNGKKAPYVGNICMDVCMIDVTDIDCREGDQAIIFGDDLPITVLSDKLETIPYEVLTSISTRVKRVYYQD